MNIIVIVSFCIVAVIICKAIEKDSREIKYVAVLAVSVAVIGFITGYAEKIIEITDSLFEAADIDDMYIEIIFKGLGICYLTQFASDYCKDCGENVIASQVTLAGKMAMLIISLPLFSAFTEIVKALLI